MKLENDKPMFWNHGCDDNPNIKKLNILDGFAIKESRFFYIEITIMGKEPSLEITTDVNIDCMFLLTVEVIELDTR